MTGLRPGAMQQDTAQAGLQARNISKSWRGRHVVEDVSLEVAPGAAIGLLGPNGAGKTTIFYVMTGLISADRGIVTLDGKDITHLPMYQRARCGIGYLPQEPSIFRGLSVARNIQAVLEFSEPDRRLRAQKCTQLLEEFSISHLRDAPAIALSGGERRRVEIARALAGNPRFILLDEPFSGIDPLAISSIQDMIRKLTGIGIGVLITDHNVRETLKLVDRAYIIAEGVVLAAGAPEQIVSNTLVRTHYLGDEFTI